MIRLVLLPGLDGTGELFADRYRVVRFIARGTTVALATIYRDRESLEFERELERR